MATPTGNTGTDALTALPNPAFIYGPLLDPQFIEDLDDMFIIQQNFGQSGSIVYTLAYEGVEANKAYEGILHIAADAVPLTATNGYYRMSITINVFGNIVYRETELIDDQARTIHFSFLNTANTNSQVVITYQGHFDDANPISYTNFLQFGIIEHNQVFNENG